MLVAIRCRRLCSSLVLVQKKERKKVHCLGNSVLLWLHWGTTATTEHQGMLLMQSFSMANMKLIRYNMKYGKKETDFKKMCPLI